jgi:hypothetical protein
MSQVRVLPGALRFSPLKAASPRRRGRPRFHADDGYIIGYVEAAVPQVIEPRDHGDMDPSRLGPIDCEDSDSTE